ncbi:MAG: uracil-DNA glycosylase [Oscillospiraceae bacterium]|nr:uracil-DNA glycosylase [Oscillospiraceae bacterium]
MDLDALGAWRAVLAKELDAPYFAALTQRVARARAAGAVYPPEDAMFAALRLTPPDKVKAVILGQDPYHEPGQAMGLSFSVPSGTKLPPSLRNIFTELESDVGVHAETGDLTRWAAQGVLLLNAVLTVSQGQAGSHAKFGWQIFTDAVVGAVGAMNRPAAFVLWGAQAQKKQPLCCGSAAPRLIVQSPHPSPLSSYRGFFGSRPFSKINAFLAENGQSPIDWQL